MTTDTNHLPETGKTRSSLSDAKRRLLDLRIHGLNREADEAPFIPRQSHARIPLSPEQRRIWLHISYQPDSPIYNEPFAIYRHGALDLKTLEESIHEIVRRHEIWRTSFSDDGEQVVHPYVQISLPLVDLSELSHQEQEAEAITSATVHSRKPLLLQEVPLFRVFVVRMNPDEHRLYFTIHHIIFDGISISRIFVPELITIYESFASGTPVELPLLPMQYGDYAIWRESNIKSQAIQDCLAYWKRNLSGELPTLRIALDNPRPTISKHLGTMQSFVIPDEVMRRLRILGDQQSSTPFVTLLATFKVLLFRYSQQNDLIVGSAADGRRRVELEHLMGNFLDTFAIRTRPTIELNFLEYLAQVREAFLGGLAAAAAPFDKVVELINPVRDAGYHPVFQAFFSMRPPAKPVSNGWSLEQTDIVTGTSKFDLWLDIESGEGEAKARLFYNTEILKASTVERIIAHWLVLIQSACDNPTGSIGTLPMLTARELSELEGPESWNDTTFPLPLKPLDVLIDESAKTFPDSVAIRCGNDSQTYAELIERSATLARSLTALGARSGTTVAVVLERSVHLPTALLAVLKTGASYLPVDIHMPPQRLCAQCSDAAPIAIVTQLSLVHLARLIDVPMFLIDEQSRAQSASGLEASSIDAIERDLQDIAYLIYTSGTTGKPKGVEVTHLNLLNFMMSMKSSPGFANNDVLLAVTPVSFDIAALELFLPLLCGGTVIIASYDEARDPFLLKRLIADSRCTVMQATPSTWRSLLLTGWTNQEQSQIGTTARSLKALCGGEALPRELANDLMRAGTELWNMYGPTETTVWSLIHPLDSSQLKEALVPVGKPIANTTAFILDKAGQHLPIGVSGELFIGGTCVARGYRNQRELTDMRFRNTSFLSEHRLYSTGDVAVRASDGNISILGRTDNQVKLRGYRIELEAIEAAISVHPSVSEVVTRVWDDSSGEARLSSYVVPKHGATVTVTDIRTFLRSSLPEWMIPSDVVFIPFLPLTPHGKVDRSQLEKPSRVVQSTSASECTPEEKRIAAIWTDLLQLETVGPNDNFFDLGGHSMLVAALQRRMQSELKCELSVAELFHSPTVRLQTELHRRARSGQANRLPGVHVLNPAGSRNNLFWVHYLNRDLAQEMGEEQPFVFVTLTPEDIAQLGQKPTLQSIASCHMRKIQTTQPNGPYVIGGLCVGSILAYEIASQLKEQGQIVSLLIMLDAPNPSFMAEPKHPITLLNYLPYLFKRAFRLGFRQSSLYARDRLQKYFGYGIHSADRKSEMRIAQDFIERAARTYKPQKYSGRVLLLLASERPPDQNFLIEWQGTVPEDLHSQYVDGHHRDLLDSENIKSVADAIRSQFPVISIEP